MSTYTINSEGSSSLSIPDKFYKNDILRINTTASGNTAPTAVILSFPFNFKYKVKLFGGGGGGGTTYGGKAGGIQSGTITYNPGRIIKMFVGQLGGSYSTSRGGGGGSTSFAQYKDTYSDPEFDCMYVAAGGGGSGGANNTSTLKHATASNISHEGEGNTASSAYFGGGGAASSSSYAGGGGGGIITSGGSYSSYGKGGGSPNNVDEADFTTDKAIYIYSRMKSSGSIGGAAHSSVSSAYGGGGFTGGGGNGYYGGGGGGGFTGGGGASGDNKCGGAGSNYSYQAKNYIGSATFLVADTPDNGYIEITILSDPIEYPSKPNKYISVGTWANPPIYDHDYNFVNRQPDGYEEAPDIDYSNGWNLPTPLSGASASFIYASTDSILRIENPKISASQYCWNYIKFKVNEASADNPAIVTVEAEVSSESNYDYLGCWVTQTTTKPAKKSTTGALFNISGIIAKKEYTYEITSAGTYYLHYAYEKDGSTDRNEDIGKIYRIVLPQPQNNTSGARIKYNNLWKPLKDTKLKIDGTWKGASKIYVKINDKWVPQIDSTYFEIENLVSPYWWESLTVSGTGASKNIIDCVINGKKHSKVVSIQTGSSTATVTIPSIRQVKPTEVFVSIAANNQTGTGIQSIQGVNDGGYYAFSMSGDVTCPTYSYNNTQFNLRQYYIADNGDGESDAQIRIKISENSTVTLAAPVLIDMSNYENSKTYNTTSGGTFYNLLKTIDGDYEFDGIRYL